MENTNITKSKSSKKILIIIFILILVGTISKQILYSINNKRLSIQESLNQQAENNLSWVKVVSPDNNFSMELPQDYKFESDDNVVGSLYSYSWSVKLHQGFVGYIVKYEDYEPSFKKLNINQLDETASNKFLKALADAEIEKFKISGFSSEFINIQGFHAIKFTGKVIKDTAEVNIEQYIILVNKSVYTISSFYVSGYKNEIYRIVNSLSIK